MNLPDHKTRIVATIGPASDSPEMLERLMPTSNLAIFFLQTFLILPLVPATAWFLCLTPAEKGQAKTILRHALGR